MKLPLPQPDWPATWQHAAGFDRLEFGGSREQPGYTLAYQRRFALTLELVRRAAPPPARVLDVAAAQGNFTLALAEQGYAVTWNDLREELAGYVKQKYEHGAVEYRPGNAFALNFPEPFDVVVATEIIEHVAHPDEFLRQLAQLVRPGGHAVITTPNGGYFRNQLPRFSACADPSVFEARQFGPDAADHIFLLHEDELQVLAQQAGWKAREMKLHTSFVLNGHCGLRPLACVLPGGVMRTLDNILQTSPRSWRRKLDVGLAVLLQRE